MLAEVTHPIGPGGAAGWGHPGAWVQVEGTQTQLGLRPPQGLQELLVATNPAAV